MLSYRGLAKFLFFSCILNFVDVGMLAREEIVKILKLILRALILGTDFSTHLSLKRDGHPMWSWVTLSWTFTSFVIHLGIFCFRWIKKKLRGKTVCPEPESSKVTRDKGTSILIWFEKIFCQVFIEENFTEVCYHVPFVQTGRNIYHAWRLYKLGYGRPDFDVSKSSEVEAILKEVGLAGQYECFFVFLRD